MIDHWESFRRRVDGQLVSSYVNLGIRDSVPIADKPILIRISVHLRIHRDNGQAHQDESAMLLAIESGLRGALMKHVDVVAVGRVTTKGCREFYYYAPSFNGLSQRVASIMSNFPEYKYEIAGGRNPSWDFYLNVLYPFPIQLQCIHNRAVVQSLSDSGDEGGIPRPIEHFSFFKSALDRDQFIKAAREQGFTLKTNGLTEGEDADYPLGATYYRTDQALLEVIDQLSIKLDELSRTFNGKYDGWETEIVKYAPVDIPDGV